MRWLGCLLVFTAVVSAADPASWTEQAPPAVPADPPAAAKPEAPKTVWARAFHTAVWTGKEMIVWGGETRMGRTNTGLRFNPETKAWTTTSLENAPVGRSDHNAVWTGKEMIVWGGLGGKDVKDLGDGGRYDPASDTWKPLSLRDAPSPCHQPRMLWTGKEVIVWFGRLPNNKTGGGARYDPVSDSWKPMTARNGPPASFWGPAVWTGKEMIVWGGWEEETATGQRSTSVGGWRYDPERDVWKRISAQGAPKGRTWHSATWTGKEMVVWGGRTNPGGEFLNVGGRYDPEHDSWKPMSTLGAPWPRMEHTATWTGSEVIICGYEAAYPPRENADPKKICITGAYNPVTDSWTDITKRDDYYYLVDHSAIWTGKQLLLFGGWNGGYLGTIRSFTPEGEGKWENLPRPQW